MRQVQAGLLTPAQFTQSQTDGCRLNSTARRVFFPAWYDDAQVWLDTPMRDSLALLLKIVRQYGYSIEG
ncbi:MAG: hypothetical protein DRR19_11895 [Candidatus Parabeggiatoa sp. nov. 1]|nr:MAG: hypothetical protein DRR19_11895 [Gammaproteobacteria bacterium]